MAYTGLMNIATVISGFGAIGRDFRHSGGVSEPTKSAVVGILAACDGRRVTDSIDDLNELLVATATITGGVPEHRLTTVSDAAETTGARRKEAVMRRRTFYQAGLPGPAGDYLIRHIVAFQSEDEEQIKHLLRRLHDPVFAPYIGRASCRPAEPMAIGYIEGTLTDALSLIKTPVVATVEVLPSMRVAHKRRVSDVIENFHTRRQLSRMVTRVAT